MSGHADTIRHYLVQYLPDGFRDEDGVWHEGPHRTQALAALDALLAENQRLREAGQRVLDSFETTGFEEDSESLLALIALREALAGDAE